MRDFTKRQSPGHSALRFFVGVFGVAVLSFVSLGAANAAWGMYGKFNEAAVSDADAQQNLAELNAQESQVKTTVDALSTARGQEAQLRQSYGVALPGEGEIHLVREATSTPEVKPQEPSIWVKIWRTLFVW